MKYVPLPAFDVVTSALNFDTPDCHVTGGCDLYTTKAAGSDKKLYKNIDRSLESQHNAMVNYSRSLSPPMRETVAASLALSRASPFGNLSNNSSRKTFAYMIATLNASHPDYDFSHVLRPQDFKRERNLRKVMNNIDSTLNSVRPNSSFLDVASGTRSSPRPGFSAGLSTSPAWGPHMWAMVDKEMTLNECTVFSYEPADDPFDEEEGAIWALHYFFFSKTLKRVCYMYVRGVPVMSHSPRLRPRLGSVSELSSSLKRRGLGLDDFGANKRARFWLGDHAAERVIPSDDEDDEDDDLFEWNRGADGRLLDGSIEDFDDESELDGAAKELSEDDDHDGADTGDREESKSPVRGVSEDIAARMELEA